MTKITKRQMIKILTSITVVAISFFIGRQIGIKEELARSPKVLGAQTENNKPLKIGLNPWVGNGLYYAAQQKGFFAAQQVNVQIVPYDDSAVGKQLLATGKIDVLPLTADAVITLADAGVPVKVIGISDSSQGADGIISAKNINSIIDLKGKTIAYEIGSPSHLFLAMLLDQQGLTTNDLVTVNETAPDAATSFLAGKVDAAVTWMPWLSEAAKRPGGHLLADSKVLSLFPDLYIVRADTLQSRSQDINAMLRALFAAQDWIMSNTANQNETYHITAQNLSMADQDIISQSSTFRWLNYQENLAYFNNGQIYDLLQKAVNLWQKSGLIKNKININNLIDDSFIKNLWQ